MLNTPVQDIKLPDDLEKAIRDAKNTLSLAEAEYQRLKDLRVSEEVTLVQLRKDIVYLEEQNEGLINSITEAENLKQSLSAQNTILSSEIEEKNSEKVKIDSQILERERTIYSKEIEIEERFEEVVVREVSVTEKERQNTEKEAVLNEKLTKISEFADSLK